MKKWWAGFLVVLLACLPIFLNRGTGSGLLQDTDTAVLLQTVRQRHAPLSWFAGDWPLQNHFYRPLPTLTFELDNALYGNKSWGYGLTNAILAILCVLLLFWFLREITNSPIVSTLAASLFAFWVSGWLYDYASDLIAYASYVALAILVYRVLRNLNVRPYPWKRVSEAAAAFLTLYYASFEVDGGAVTAIREMPFRMIQWLPGRTASVMTVFCLIAMASYARYERTDAEYSDKPPQAADHAPTKGTTQMAESKAAWVWGVIAIVAGALAFASYEQSVMLPAALLGVAICLRMQRYRVRWAWQVAFWLLLVGYLILRKELLPAGISGYQRQQLRFGPGVWLSLSAYLFPFWGAFEQGVTNVASSLLLFLNADIYWVTLNFAANVVAFFQSRRRLAFALTGWALSVITFLPMAWLKHFEHYDFWPMAMRSLFAVTLCWVSWDLIVIAASPPATQAPPRPDLLPDSPLHP